MTTALGKAETSLTKATSDFEAESETTDNQSKVDAAAKKVEDA
jgi:hypothetical protein